MKPDSKMIEEALKKFKGNIKKLPTKEARGVLEAGGSCAAAWGSSALGKAQARNNYLKEAKDSERKRSERLKGPATPNQIRVLREHGAYLREGISKREAWVLVRQLNRTRKKLESEKRKRDAK